MKISRLILFLTLITLTGVLPFVSKSQNATVEGYVTNGLTGDPLGGAEIDISGVYIIITGSDGYYYFDELWPGVHNISCGAYGNLCGFDTTFTVYGGELIQLDIQLYPCPEIVVEPLELEETLEPNEQTTEIITISNTGLTSVEWEAELEIFPPQSYTDFFEIGYQAPLSGDMEIGIESDGEFFYTTSPFISSFNKYILGSSDIETFTIPGIPGIYDLAFDGTYFYGACGSSTIYKLDFNQQLLIGTINLAQNIRALTYNSDEQIFYGCEVGGDIIEFDHDGVLYNTYPIGSSDTIFSSFAYDNESFGSPFLWGYGTINNISNMLMKIELPTFQFTEVTVNLNLLLSGPVSNESGGIFINPNIFPGNFDIIGIVRGELWWSLEISNYSQWLSIEPSSGLLEAGETSEITVNFDATDIYPWDYNAEIQFNTLPNVETSIVDVLMHIEGPPPWAQNLIANINCTDIILNWEVFPMVPIDSFHILKDSLYYATVFDTHFVDSLVSAEEEHSYYVTCYFYIGWESYPSEIVNVSVPIPDSLEPINLEGIASEPNENDVTLVWEDPDGCLAPDGYNIYRDGEQINDELVTSLTFIDPNVLSYINFVEYYITSVYYFGESGPSSSVFILLGIGINKKEISSVSIFPNPAKEKLFIQSPFKINQIELLNNLGLIILTNKVNSDTYQLDVSSVNPGIYFLKIGTVQGLVLRKVLIQ